MRGRGRRWQWLSKKPAQKALRELSRPVNELINREGGGKKEVAQPAEQGRWGEQGSPQLYSWIDLDLWETDRLGLGSVSHGSCGFE